MCVAGLTGRNVAPTTRCHVCQICVRRFCKGHLCTLLTIFDANTPLPGTFATRVIGGKSRFYSPTGDHISSKVVWIRNWLSRNRWLWHRQPKLTMWGVIIFLIFMRTPCERSASETWHTYRRNWAISPPTKLKRLITESYLLSQHINHQCQIWNKFSWEKKGI